MGYPPPKPNSSRKEHIFTEKDKEAGDSRAQQVLKCKMDIYSYSIRTVLGILDVSTGIKLLTIESKPLVCF